MNRLFGMGEPPLKVFAMIIRQFRLILKTKCLEVERTNVSVIAGELRVPPFIAEKYRKQSTRFSLGDLRRIYDLLHKTDVAIKSGDMRADIALETLIGRMFIDT
jgi:DNA polymerase-3 subunit delta